MTGGGLRNLLRLKKSIGFEIDNPMKPNRVFDALQELGSVEDKEMYQTFNMGMGYCMVVPEDEASAVVKASGRGAKVVGRAAKSPGVRVPGLRLSYTKY
jgi:phosphoribosylformylglycinamidine cyclo-ligase